MEVSSLQKVVEMLEEVVVGWPEVRWLWQMRQNFVAQFVQLLKHWLYDVWLGVVMEKNWALPVGQCWLHALQFLVHLIYLLSILLRCNGFTRTQKAVVDQTGSRPPNSDHDLLLVHVWLWEVLWSLFLIQPLIITYNPLFIACHNPIKKWFPVVAKNMRRWHFKMMIFLIFGQLVRHPLIELFHLSSLLQMSNDYRMVNIEFFGSFLYSCERISFDDCFQWVTVNFCWPAAVLLIF